MSHRSKNRFKNRAIDSWLRSGSPVIAAALIFALSFSCNQIKKLESDAKFAFSGASSVLAKSLGKYVVGWSNASASANASISYNVYTYEVKATSGIPETVLQAKGTTIDARGEYKIVALNSEVQPAVVGELSGQVGNANSFELNNVVNPGTYAIQVRAVQDGLTQDKNAMVILLTVSANTDPDFKGCLEADIKEDRIDIKYQYPENATSVTIMRDGIAVYTSKVASVSTFSDFNVKQGITYSYSCLAKVEGDAVVGVNTLDVMFPDPISDLKNFLGCLSGSAISTSSIVLNYEFPSTIDEIKLYRDGTLIFTATDKSISTFTDRNLTEGTTYNYKCKAFSGEKSLTGSRSLDIATLAVNPPTFAGITAITAVSASSLRVNWGIPSGTTTNRFDVYCNTGNAVDWTIAKKAGVDANGTFNYTLTGLADELTYYCGVRACNTASGTDVCETNTAALSVTLPDGGVPTSPGATAVSIVNGAASLTVPWQASYGGVKKRYVYQCTGTLAACGTTLANYNGGVPVQTNVATNLWAPNTTLTLGSLSENTTYNYIVVDEDPSGGKATARNVVSVSTGDLTAPTFLGLSSLTVGSAGSEDTTLTLAWTAIAKESVSPATGASHYMIYKLNGAGDACASGTLLSELDSSAYTNGSPYTYVVTGLTARTAYSFCMKARDSTGNISVTTQYYTRTTLDITAPSFDGVQSISYSTADALMSVTWNRSSSSDRNQYRVKLWKASDATVRTFYYNDASNPSGTTFSKTSLGSFTFTDNDRVYVIVDACDDANTIAGGSVNCTAFATALFYDVPDVTPPANFLGIAAASNFTTPAEGQINVVWTAPASWTDYRGFKIYQVAADNSLTLLKSCACSAADCPDHLTSCLVTGLDYKRTYKLHVRAYDNASGGGNITTYLDPANSYASKATSDTTAPTFNANFSVSMSGQSVLGSWTAASDNQYSSEPGATITYKMYRKTGSTFANVNQPQNDDDPTSPDSTTNASFADIYVDAGVTYYYTVCAEDTSGNKTCGGSAASITVPDIVNPSITSLATNKTATGKTWNLSWAMADNVTANASLIIEIRRKEATTASDFPSTTDEIWADYTGVTSVGSLTGPLNADKYVNYRVTVKDASGNKASATISVFSQNLVTVTSVSRSGGNKDGGKLVQIVGTGFLSGATVAIGGNTCTAPHVFLGSTYTSIGSANTTKLICLTPASASEGSKNVVVTNSDGSSGMLSGGYAYCAEANCSNICDKPSSWGASFASGNGTGSANPYKICNGTHLNNMRNSYTSYYSLEDNVDLSSYTGNSFTPIGSGDCSSYFTRDFPGNNFVVANWTYSVGHNCTGLFSYFYAAAIRDFGMVNMNVTNSGGSFRNGGVVGYIYDGTINNVFSTGTITANTSARVGGIVGESQYTIYISSWSSATVNGWQETGGLIGKSYRDDSITDSYAKGNISANNLGGGLIGYVESPLTTTISNVYATGNVSGASYVGGLIGQAYSGPLAITNSYATGNVTVTSATQYAGGFMGEMYSITANFNNNYATGSVTSTATGAPSYWNGIGGFFGRINNSFGTIQNTYATGNVSAVNAHSVGGFVGVAYTAGAGVVVTNCRATGSVTSGDGNYYIGGFAGWLYIDTTWTKNYATGNVVGGNYVGGFVGYAYPANYPTVDKLNIEKSYATGNVTANAATGLSGGFFGGLYSGTSIRDSYSTGNATGASSMGGFGGIGLEYQNIAINRCYSVGNVTLTGPGPKGGFYGASAAYHASTSVNNSFWNTAIAGASSYGGTGKTTAEMKTEATFSAVGWDFSSGTPVWKISAGEYPKLYWQP